MNPQGNPSEAVDVSKDMPGDGQLGAEAVVGLDQVLAGVARLLRATTPAQYRAVPENLPGVAASIGGHTRHCLDHLRALLDGAESGTIDYDRRLRGTAIEADRDAALNELERLRQRLKQVPRAALAGEVSVRCAVCADEAPRAYPSTLAREMVFVLSHTIHHNALLAVLAGHFGIAVPPDFGYAPSTLAWQQQQES